MSPTIHHQKSEKIVSGRVIFFGNPKKIFKADTRLNHYEWPTKNAEKPCRASWLHGNQSDLTPANTINQANSISNNVSKNFSFLISICQQLTLIKLNSVFIIFRVFHCNSFSSSAASSCLEKSKIGETAYLPNTHCVHKSRFSGSLAGNHLFVVCCESSCLSRRSFQITSLSLLIRL